MYYNRQFSKYFYYVSFLLLFIVLIYKGFDKLYCIINTFVNNIVLTIWTYVLEYIIMLCVYYA